MPLRDVAAHVRGRSTRTLAALSVAALAACTTLRPVGAGTAVSLRSPLPPEVVVTVTGWPEAVVLHAAQVLGDSLVGRQVGAFGRETGTRVAIPVASVTSVREQRVGAVTSVSAAVGIAVAFAAVLLAVVLTQLRID